MISSEQEFLKIGKQIKCPECAGQTIDTSTTPLSIELKKYVVNQLNQGAKSENIISEIKKKYGEDIFVDSSFSIASSFIWIAPVFFIFFILFLVRKKKWL
tara:strand:- start:8230 stop:8529 length:300 start_codon:yes stop_codon:yes gene_type:complete